MTTQSYESLLAEKRLGSAVGGNDPAMIVAAKDSSGDAAALNLDADGNLLVATAGGGDSGGATAFALAGSLLTRPANTTTYASNDSVSNDATAANVTANTVDLGDLGEIVSLTQVELDSTDTGFANATLRLHLFNSDPTANSGVVAGDNAGYSQKKAGWVGSFSGTLFGFTDGSRGLMLPDGPSVLQAMLGTGGVLWWQLQVLGVSPVPSANSTTFMPTFRGYKGVP